MKSNLGFNRAAAAGTNRLALCIALAATLGIGLSASTAYADSFTYHGSLQDAGKPANGNYDLELTLFSAQTGGHVVAGPTRLYGVKVKDGNFVTNVDFGSLGAQTAQGWVEVKVKSASAGDFVSLDSRSPVPLVAVCPGAWTLQGNAGNPGGSYLGTADVQPLLFEVNGTEGGRFENVMGENPQFKTFGRTSLAFSDGANGAESIAAGFHGHTLFEGSFNWSPRNGTIGNSPDTANEQFIINSPHGVGINTSLAPDGTPLRDELTIHPSADLPGSNADLTFETATGPNGYNGFNVNGQTGGFFQINGLYNTAGALSYDSLLYIDYHHTSLASNWQLDGASANGIFTVGFNSGNGNGAFLSPVGVWTNASSRTFKEGFAAIDPMTVLQKLVSMPVKTWFYKGNHDDGQHMGPVAEEFAASFGLGSNEKYIGTVDESGVALAAIQGLNKKLEAENADLRDKLASVLTRLDNLESHKGE